VTPNKDERLEGWRGLIDRSLDTAIVPGFGRLGPLLRRRLSDWEAAVAAAGRKIVITGATSGLGLAAAQQLASAGASLVLVGRSEQKLAEAHKLVSSYAEGGEVETMHCDMGDLDQVRTLASQLKAAGPLDVLIHNAGALDADYQLAPQGHELTITVHLIAPYLLTELLRPALTAAKAPRVITVTSGGMYSEAFNLKKLEMRPDNYRGTVAYARAKRAQVVLTKAWQQRAGTSIDFHLMHPGWADSPGMERALPTFHRLLGWNNRSTDDGADTITWLAGRPDHEPRGGQLWLDRQARPIFKIPKTKVSDAELAKQGEALMAWLAEVSGQVSPPFAN